MVDEDKVKEKVKAEVKKELESEVKKEKNDIKRYAVEFKDFIKEYAIIGMAIAFIMGGATKDLVNSLVSDIIMPIVNVFVPDGGWKESILMIGPVEVAWGHFLSAILNFCIMAVVVFIIAKKVLGKKEVKKI